MSSHIPGPYDQAPRLDGQTVISRGRVFTVEQPDSFFRMSYGQHAEAYLRIFENGDLMHRVRIPVLVLLALGDGKKWATQGYPRGWKVWQRKSHEGQVRICEYDEMSYPRWIEGDYWKRFNHVDLSVLELERIVEAHRPLGEIKGRDIDIRWFFFAADTAKELVALAESAQKD